MSKYWGSPGAPQKEQDRGQRTAVASAFLCPLLGMTGLAAGSRQDPHPRWPAALGTQKPGWPGVCKLASSMDHKAARGRGCPAAPSPCPHAGCPPWDRSPRAISNAVSSPTTPAAARLDAHHPTLEMQQTPGRVIPNTQRCLERAEVIRKQTTVPQKSRTPPNTQLQVTHMHHDRSSAQHLTPFSALCHL